MTDKGREALVHNPFDVMAQSLTGMNAELTVQEEQLRRTKAGDAIEKYLGREYAEKCKLTFQIADHIITDELADLIKERDTDLVLGEISYSNLIYLADDLKLENVPKKSLLEKVLNPGYGVNSPEEAVKYADYVKSFVREGVSFVATDANQTVVLMMKNEVPQAMTWGVDIALLLSLAGMLGTSTLKKDGSVSLTEKILKLKDEPMTRRDFLKLTAATGSFLALSGTAGLIAGYNSQLDSGDVNTDIGPTLGEMANQTSYRIEDIVSSPEFIGFNRSVIELRNDIMTLNTWNTLARVVDTNSSDPLNVLYMAGDGHLGSYTDFLKGPDALKAKVKVWSDTLCNKTLPYLLSPQSGLTADQAWNTFAQFASLFTEPCILGDQSLRVTMEGDPKSACEVLFESMNEKISRLGDSKEDSDQKNMMLYIINLILDQKKTSTEDLANRTEKIRES